MKQQGQISKELEVRVHANEVWDIYGGRKLGMMVAKLLPDIIQRVEFLQGDGGLDTIFEVEFRSVPGLGVLCQKEKIIVLDQENRIKVVDVIEGGCLNLGFRRFRMILEFIEKDVDASIIKSTIEYEIEDEIAAKDYPLSIDLLVTIGEAVEKYLIDNHANESI